MSAETVHANCLIVGTHGLLIRGGAGSGKTTLAETMIEAARRKGNFGALVADDYVSVTGEGGRLVARVPETIRGKMEVRGFGLVELDCEPVAQVGLIVTLVPLHDIERLPDEALTHDSLDGVRLPVVTCPEHQTFTSLRLIRWAFRTLFPHCPDYI
ncbi:HPr kinase/phosphorylase [Roseibium sp.]|uniref:HPr kinase/phosphorylase n=1 Tax=Roseibium sp. TaxID=1936156 RepID=UPI003D125349